MSLVCLSLVLSLSAHAQSLPIDAGKIAQAKQIWADYNRAYSTCSYALERQKQVWLMTKPAEIANATSGDLELYKKVRPLIDHVLSKEGSKQSLLVFNDDDHESSLGFKLLMKSISAQNKPVIRITAPNTDAPGMTQVEYSSVVGSYTYSLQFGYLARIFDSIPEVEGKNYTVILDMSGIAHSAAYQHFIHAYPSIRFIVPAKKEMIQSWFSNDAEGAQAFLSRHETIDLGQWVSKPNSTEVAGQLKALFPDQSLSEILKLIEVTP